MKGVILSRCPAAQLVDLTHEVPPQAIRTGALRLASAAPYFPAGTVHLVVVDPGVGGERRPLAIEARGHFFVGPDNGVLSLAAFPSTAGLRAVRLAIASPGGSAARKFDVALDTPVVVQLSPSAGR